jgi:hypothetical protein
MAETGAGVDTHGIAWLEMRSSAKRMDRTHGFTIGIGLALAAALVGAP